jgi:DmsE family decaheme c-type cytochrome
MKQVALILMLLASACAPGTSERKPTPEAQAAAVATFVGEEACVACHQDVGDAYTKTVHGVALAGESRPESERGCEACHGPGSIHGEEAGDTPGGMVQFRPTEPAAARSRACVGCHGESRLHTFLSGGHALAQVACSDCHAVHAAKAAPLLRERPASLCNGCHQDVRLRFGLPEHHKVPEGVMTCLDCHEPHGSRNDAALKDTQDRLCTSCHANVQGPFVFEHGGLLTEGCTRCHEPHGSPNRHLLAAQQVAQVCLECHTSTPRDHAQPAFRDCTRCHVAIHGSNVDPHFMAP